MTDNAWSDDPRFNKSAAAVEFAGLRETVEKNAGFVAGIEPDQTNPVVDPAAPRNDDASYTQQQVDELVAAARAEALAEAEVKTEQQIEQVRAENKEALQQEFAAFMGALQSDIAGRQPLLKPLRDLALALAEHLARVELSQSDAAVDAVINAAINDLDPTDLGQIEIHVSEPWAERLKAKPLQGVTDGYPVIADDGLSDGDVRLVVNDAQVEDLITERLQQLAQQLDATDFTSVTAVDETAQASGEDPADAAMPESAEVDARIESPLTDSAETLDAAIDPLPATDVEPNEE
ncbi:MAG TPA: hypothetical protein DHU16_05015 [Gammaproteobacteria bacterium]|nr:hypothetical protein [Gammaproteobacteria bacterium]